MGEQRVTDDVLDHWASEARKEPPGKLGSIDLPAVVGMLIADVRASRAREAAQTTRILEVDTALRQMAEALHRALAKRDVLQQRIDFQHGVAQGWLANWKAAQQRIDTGLAATYASDDGTEYEHTHPPAEGEPECPACWAETIRAALS